MNFRSFVAFVGVAIGFNSTIFMQTYVATALPTIADDLHGFSLYSWITTVYMLAITVTIPLFGKMGDQYGKPKVLLSGMTIFTLASCFLAFSSSMEWVIAFRLIQGLGAGAIAPPALALLSDIFDGSSKGMAFGIMGLLQVSSIMAGPLIGGWFTDYWSWRWGFFLMLPLSLLAMICVMRGDIRKQVKRNDQVRFDWIGSIVLGCAFSLGLFSVQELGEGELLIGGVGIALFLAILVWILPYERKHPDPAIPIRLITTPRLGAALTGSFLIGIVQYGAVIYIPLYVQKVMGGSATESGLILLPMLLSAGIISGIAGVLIDRFSVRVLSLAGWTVAFLGFFLLGQMRGTGVTLTLSNVLIGLCLGLLLTLFIVESQESAGVEHRTVTSGMAQMARYLGGAVSVPLLVIWLPQSAKEPIQEGLSHIFFSLGAIAVVGMLMAWLLSRPSYAMKQINSNR